MHPRRFLSTTPQTCPPVSSPPKRGSIQSLQGRLRRPPRNPASHRLPPQIQKVKLLPLSCRMITCQRPIQLRLNTLLWQSFLSRIHLLQRAYSGHFSLSSTLLPVHRNKVMTYKIRIRPLLIQLKCHCLWLQVLIPNRTLPPPSAP